MPEEFNSLLAGVDEVGRGCLFGPVMASAVILSDRATQRLLQMGLTDSKQLQPQQRQKLSQHIQSMALDCKLGLASAAEIDRFNILQATLLAMKRAVLKLELTPDLCLIDGNQQLQDLHIRQQAVVKGDRLHPCIAAASIIAKVWRDALIERLDESYYGYDLKNNKGYGTVRHRQALQKLGPSPQHRQSFAPCQVSPQL